MFCMKLRHNVLKLTVLNCISKVLQYDMPKACEEMSVSGRTILMAVQRLQADPGCQDSRDNMVVAAKKLLQTTMKVK